MVHEERHRFLRRRVSPVSHRKRTSGKQRLHKWEDLPESLLQLILVKLQSILEDDETHESLLAMYLVCRSWRAVAEPYLFRSMWEGEAYMTISHPLQLFALSPKSDSQLVKCYIIRQSSGANCGSRSVIYRLYHGNDPTSNNTKFLMSAIQRPWHNTLMYLNKEAKDEPCAKMASCVLGTSHKLLRCDGSIFERASGREELCMELPRSETLASVKYKLRMKGMMRPRRLHVSLPKPTYNGSFREDPTEQRTNLLERICSLRGLQSTDYSSSEALRAPISFRSKATNMKLVNKPPHWNEGLKCWCLNFRGRVKLASVKNFQLVCDTDGSGRIVMQFGKVSHPSPSYGDWGCPQVDANVFIMDFNPTVISTVQAFSIALTSFEGKALL